MTEEDALQLAEGAAVQEGWDLSEFEPPIRDHDGHIWRFFYRGKLPVVGNHFSVIVESSGRARIVPGC